MSTVLSAFQTLSLEDRALGFTHENLSVVARQTRKKQNEVEEFFARFLLQNFSLGSPLSHQSENLHRTYLSMQRRQLAIVDALLHGKDVECLPVVQQYLAGFSHTTNQSEILSSETKSAVLSHDEVVSFPDIYFPLCSFLQVPSKRYAKHLFACIDQKIGIPFIEVSNIARFFYKHVALYRPGKILVWRDLFVEWVTKSGKVEAIGRIEGSFPYSWLRKISHVASDASTSLSFQEYVYAETIAVLESHIGFPLDEDFRKQILKQMEDENFRRHLAFFLGHFSYLLQTLPARTSPAFQWLVAIRRFVFFQRFYSFSEDKKNLLFRFLFYAESLPETFVALDRDFADLPKIEEQLPINYFVVFFSQLEEVFRGEDFWKRGLHLLSICVGSNRDVENYLKGDCLLELGKSSYCTVSMQHLEQFFHSPFDQENFYQPSLIVFLKEIRIQGCSDRFLPVFCDPLWDGQKVRLAREMLKELGKDGIEIEEVIAIFSLVLQGKLPEGQLLSDLKTKVFAGNPLPECALPNEMQEHSDLALWIQNKHKLSPAETFRIFLWNLSQEKDSLKQRCRLSNYIAAFPGLEMEKDSVLKLFHPDTNIEQLRRAINQLVPLSIAHSTTFIVSLK